MTKPDKILIGGTGRAGTSVLMAILSYCGINTGYEKGAYMRVGKSKAEAGLEDCDYAALVIKQPKELSENIPQFDEAFNIRHFIIPFRNIDEATYSRTNRGEAEGGLTPNQLGVICQPTEQKDILLWRLGKMFNDLTEHNVPYTVIHFPRFVNDKSYLYEKLKPIFPELDLKELEECYELFVHEKDK
jgi:hypothetical protein